MLAHFRVFPCSSSSSFILFRPFSSGFERRKLSMMRTNRSVKDLEEMFPSHFQKRVREWIKLLKGESKALLDKGKHWKLNVPLKQSTREPILGHRLLFSLEKLNEQEKQLLNNVRARDLVRLTPKRPPPAENNNISHKAAENEKNDQEKEGGGVGGETKEDEENNTLKGRIMSKDSIQLAVRLHGVFNPEYLTSKLAPDLDANQWCIESYSTNSYERMLDLLCNPNKLEKYPGYKLMLYAYKVKMGEKEKRKKLKDKLNTPKMDKNLNKAQVEAIAAAINPNRPIVAIHGPPGTGKTKVIAEIVYQISRKKRVLVCAPSNKAVDSVMGACKQRGLKSFLRLGESDDGELRIYELDTAALKHGEYQRVKEAIYRSKELEGKPDFVENKVRQRRVMDIWRESGEWEDQIRKDTLEDISVIFCTSASGHALRFLEKGWFQPDLVVLDEAAQLVECTSWIMLLHAPRCVIVGDHKQLPPVLLSTIQNGKFENVGVGGRFSFLEYLKEAFPKKDFFRFLSIQYRSNALIQQWSNKQFYEGKLVADWTAKELHLVDLIKKNGPTRWHHPIAAEGRARVSTTILEKSRNSKQRRLLIDDPLVLVDTELGLSNKECWNEVYKLYRLESPLSFLDEKKANSLSYFNIGEAFCAFLHLRALHLVGGLEKCQIGCITPYFSQTESIRQLFVDDENQPEEGEEQFTISSVDAFQGQEREAIVMSFVRNNARGELGFLREHRRTNVAITRARRQFLLIASSKMLRRDEVLRELYGVIKAEGLIVGADELLPGALALGRRRMEEEEERMMADGQE